jgi:hypothetical protein
MRDRDKQIVEREDSLLEKELIRDMLFDEALAGCRVRF